MRHTAKFEGCAAALRCAARQATLTRAMSAVPKRFGVRLMHHQRFVVSKPPLYDVAGLVALAAAAMLH